MLSPTQGFHLEALNALSSLAQVIFLFMKENLTYNLYIYYQGRITKLWPIHTVEWQTTICVLLGRDVQVVKPRNWLVWFQCSLLSLLWAIDNLFYIKCITTELQHSVINQIAVIYSLSIVTLEKLKQYDNIYTQYTIYMYVYTVSGMSINVYTTHTHSLSLSED